MADIRRDAVELGLDTSSLGLATEAVATNEPLFAACKELHITEGM